MDCMHNPPLPNPKAFFDAQDELEISNDYCGKIEHKGLLRKGGSD